MANQTIQVFFEPLGMLSALLKRNILSTAILASIGVAVNADAQTICAPIQANSIEPNKLSGHVMDQAELEAKGKALRKAIDAKYRELEAPGGAFYSPPSPPNPSVEVFRNADVTDLVLKYIPIGMSLEDAIVILRAAGIKSTKFVPIGGGAMRSEDIDPVIILSFNNTNPAPFPPPNKNSRIDGHISLVADMRWFTGFGISISSGSPKGYCVSTIYAGFTKQLH